jgi:hypothetical protein
MSDQGNAMSDASETLRRWYAAWNAHEPQAISSLLTDDVRYEDPSAYLPTLRGRAAVEGYAAAAFAAMPDLRLEMLEEWVRPDGEVSATYFRFSGTFEAPLRAPGLPELAPTGGRVELLGIDRNEIADGRLRRHQIFWDMAEMGRMLAVFPPRGSRSEKLSRRFQHLQAWRLRRRS